MNHWFCYPLINQNKDWTLIDLKFQFKSWQKNKFEIIETIRACEKLEGVILITVIIKVIIVMIIIITIIMILY